MNKQEYLSDPNQADAETSGRAAFTGKPMGYDPAAEEQKIVVNDIQGKWAKFSDRDLSCIEEKDDLIAQVQLKYKLNRHQAQKDVESLLAGRVF